MAFSAYDIVVGEPLNRAVPWDIWLHRMIRRKGWGTKSYIIAYERQSFHLLQLPSSFDNHAHLGNHNTAGEG